MTIGRHDALIYDDDEDLLAVAVPFLREGLESGEATILAVSPQEELLILGELDDPGELTVLGAAGYRSAAQALEDQRTRFVELLAGGAPAVRIAGSLPLEGDDWTAWASYETAMHAVIENLAVHALCLYDRRRVASRILADVRCLYSHFLEPGGVRTPSPDFPR